MKITEIEKNKETWHSRYRTYKASFVNQTGLPKFSRDTFDKVLEANLYSPSRAKKANLEVTDEIGGWYRVMNGYKPLFAVKEIAGQALLESLKDIKAKETTEIGSYRGFNMQVYFDSFHNEHKLVLKGNLSHTLALGSDVRGNLIRIDNTLENMPKRLEEVKTHLENLYNQQENAKLEKDKPFPQEQELKEKSKQLAKLDLELKLTENSHEDVQEKDDVIIEKSHRPSVLNALKTTAPQKGEPKQKRGYSEER